MRTCCFSVDDVCGGGGWRSGHHGNGHLHECHHQLVATSMDVYAQAPPAGRDGAWSGGTGSSLSCSCAHVTQMHEAIAQHTPGWLGLPEAGDNLALFGILGTV